MSTSNDTSDYLLEELGSGDPRRRLNALSELVQTGVSMAIPGLRDLAESDPEPLLRRLAEQGINLIEAGVTTSKPDRERFIRAVEQANNLLGPSRIKQALDRTKQSPDSSSLEGALEELSAFQGSEHARGTLVEPAGDTPADSEAEPSETKPVSRLRKGDESRYVITGEVGQGGMGVILNAFDTDFQRDVAMKVISTGWKDSREFTERFITEAQVQGKLEHPNICPVHEMGVGEDGQIYFTMKMVKGHSLADMLARTREETGTERAKRLTEILNIFLKICDGMAFAHANTIIHRDLKPDNIMIGDFGEVYVMDWGLAKVIGEDGGDKYRYGLVIDDTGSQSDTMKTMTGSVVGTPAYMPPEQAAGQVDQMDHRSDIYSLGALLYELVALQPPFPELNAWQVLAKIRTEMPLPPSHSEQALSTAPELDSIVLKCLRKDKAERYQSVAELKHEIELFLSGRPVSAMEYSFLQVFAKWIARNKVMAGAVMAVVTVIVAAASIAYVNMSRSWKNEQAARVRAEENAQAVRAALFKAERQKSIADEQREHAEKQRSVAEQRRLETEISNLRSRASLAMMYEEKKEIGEAVRRYEQIKEDLVERRLNLFPFIDLAVWRALYNNGRSVILKRTLNCGKKRIRSIALNPQGRSMAVAFEGHPIELWNIESGTVIGVVNPASGRVTSLDFHPDGNLLAAAYDDSTLRIWNIRERKLERQLCDPSFGDKKKAHVRGISFTAFSPDGRFLVSTADEVANVWDVATGALDGQFFGHRYRTVTAAFSPDGAFLATGAKDMYVQLYNVKKQTLDHVLYKHLAPVKCVTIGPGGKLLASTSEDTTIRLWDLEKNREAATLRGHEDDVNSVVFSPDGTMLMSGGNDRTVRFWDVGRQTEIAVFRSHSGNIVDTEFNHDGTLAASAGRNGLINIWSLKDDTMVSTVALNEFSFGIVSVDFSPNGATIAAGPWAPKLVPALLIDASSGELTGRLALHGGRITSLRFSPDGTKLATAAEEGIFRLTNLTTEEELCMIKVSAESETSVMSAVLEIMDLFKKDNNEIWKSVESLAYSPNGTMVATACDDPVLRVWDTKTLRCRYRFTEYGHETYAVDFSPDGTLLAAGGHGAHIDLWDMKTGKYLRRIPGKHGHVKGISFSPDGRFIAAATDSRLVPVYDVATGKCAHTLTGHFSRVKTVDYSPDGRLIATAGDDTSVKLWDTTNGQCLLTLNEHIAEVEDVRFSPDGRSLATCGRDSTVRIWRFGDALKPLELHPE